MFIFSNMHIIYAVLAVMFMAISAAFVIARKRQKRAQQLATQKLAILDAMGAAYLLFDNNGALLEISDPAKKIFIDPNEDFSHQLQIHEMDFYVWQDYLNLQAAKTYESLTQDEIKAIPFTYSGALQDVIQSHAGDYYHMMAQTVEGEQTLIYLRPYECLTRPAAPEAEQSQDKHMQEARMKPLAKLAGGIAHDFNNILALIDGYARIAAKEGQDPQSYKKFIDKIAQAAQRGAKITQKLTLFSSHSIETNSVINVRDILKQNEGYLFSAMPANIHPYMQIKGQEACIRSLDDSFVQIMKLLVDNAVEAMPGGGSVNITAEIDTTPVIAQSVISTPECMAISVMDTGCGIKPDDLNAIFDPFFTTKTENNQPGLGLSIVYGLVKQMGGTVHVTSRQSQGTQIHLYFPLCESKATRAVIGDATSPDQIKMRGFTALIVDDEPDLLEVVSDMLEEMEMTVLKANSGDEALIIQDEYEDQIDLLLTDISMPKMNGVKLAQMLSAFNDKLQVLYMSGFPGRGALEDYEIPPEADFIAKPMNYDDLALCIFQKFNADKGGVHHTPTSRWVGGSHNVH